MSAQTPDQQRIGDVETDVGVLKADARTTASLLIGIAQQLEKLTAGQYPPFSDVMRTFGSGVLTASILLGGYFYLTNAQIDHKTAQLHDRVARLEAAIAWKPTLADVVIVKNP